MKTKYFVILAILAMIFIAGCDLRWDFNSGVVNSIRTDPVTIYEQDDFTAKFQIELIGEMSGIGFNVVYDTTMMQLLNIQKSAIFEHENAVLGNGMQGKIVAGFNNSSVAINDQTATILAVTFKALKTGQTQITFSEGTAINFDTSVDAVFNDKTLNFLPRSKITMDIIIEKEP